jgi:hypothetical protein
MDNIWRQTARAAQCGAAAPLTAIRQGHEEAAAMFTGTLK